LYHTHCIILDQSLAFHEHADYVYNTAQHASTSCKIWKPFI